MSGGEERALDAALIAAHGRDDLAALVELYRAAGDLAEAGGDVDRACFFLTHAYIFALERGDGQAAALRARLVAHGRED